MKRGAIYLASAGLVAVLAMSGSAWAQMGYQNYPYNTSYNQGSYDYYGPSPNYNYSYNYGYPNGYAGYSSNYAGATAPMVTGRSVATSQPGNYCSTPVKTCELYHTSFVGNGCSCRVPGGRARGTVGSRYGYSPYAYNYDNNPFSGMFGAVTAPVEAAVMLPVAAAETATAPLMTGRSVASGQTGNYCSTPTKTCELIQPSWVGNGCSCRVPGGRSRGSVTP